MEQNKEDEELYDQNKKSIFISGMIVGLAAGLLIVSMTYLGTRLQQLQRAKNEANSSIQASMEANASTGENAEQSGEEILLDTQTLSKLQVIEQTLKQYFYLSEVTDEQLQEGMYKGMLDALEDPYSEYYTAAELVELMEGNQGIYYGIGAYVGLDTVTTLPKISSVMEGSSAEKEGLRPNDLIYAVDGERIYGKSLSEAVALIHGEEGTPVTLTLIREGESDYLEVELTRCKVESPTVNLEMLDDDMAYIQVVEFDDVTIDQFADALATAKGSGMKGMILDLRGNPGGNLNAVVDMARMILPEGMIVYTEDKNGKRVEYTGDGTRELQVPLVVLVDMNSASASEIMAGAIKDYGIGTLVGTTTYGKGIVQQIVPFTDGSAVKVTVSSYFTPKGQNIHGIGIEPDVVCEFDGETYYGSEDHYDNQLEKAKEVLLEKMGNIE